MAAAGSDVALLSDAALALASKGKSAVYVAVDGALAGLVAVADPLRPGAADAIAALSRAGIGTAMLTGDGAATAAVVAAEPGITTIRAELLPEAKVAALPTRGGPRYRLCRRRDQ